MFLGDLGGVIEFLVFISNLILMPIAEYSYNLKALEKLFVAKTQDNSLFKKDHLNCSKSKLK